MKTLRRKSKAGKERCTLKMFCKRLLLMVVKFKRSREYRLATAFKSNSKYYKYLLCRIRAYTHHHHIYIFNNYIVRKKSTNYYLSIFLLLILHILRSSSSHKLIMFFLTFILLLLLYLLPTRKRKDFLFPLLKSQIRHNFIHRMDNCQLMLASIRAHTNTAYIYIYIKQVSACVCVYVLLRVEENGVM